MSRVLLRIGKVVVSVIVSILFVLCYVKFVEVFVFFYHCYSIGFLRVLFCT